MPAQSEKQRKLFGAALAIKRGETKPAGQAAKIAGSVSEKKIEEFARKEGAKDALR